MVSSNLNSVPRCGKCGRLTGTKEHKCPEQAWNKGMRGQYGGWKLSEETRARISAGSPRHWKGTKGNRFGKKHTEEARAKLRKPKTEAHKAKLRKPKSPEWIANWREARIRNGSFANSEEQKRRHSERMTGSANPNWKGGLSFEPYPTTWTRALRRRIRDRDSHMCQICGVVKDSRNLDVHHIDYDKANCEASNLITLCIRCHRQTNFNREYWQQFLTEKINACLYHNSDLPSSGQAA